MIIVRLVAIVLIVLIIRIWIQMLTPSFGVVRALKVRQALDSEADAPGLNIERDVGRSGYMR